MGHDLSTRSLRIASVLIAFALPLSGCMKPMNSRGPASVDEAGQEQVQNPDKQTPNELDAAKEQLPDVVVSASQRAQILAKYDYLDPKHVVPTKLLADAVVYLDSHSSSFKNQNYLSVIDFSKNSRKARFYIVNLKDGSVWAIHNAAGSGSDPDHDGYATKFSNKSGSNMSSLGYYRTAETYFGKHGLSLRLDGLSSTNSNVRARAIVVHGASYVSDANINQGRSWGCPAVSMADRDAVIAKLKNGSLIYAGLSGVR
jgi:hypothetical protein